MELEELPISGKKTESYIQKKAELIDEITAFENEINQIKNSKKEIPRKITFAQLPESEKFDNAINDRKRFLDIIKMIAYRAETAMSNMIKQYMAHPNESRVLLQQIYQANANIYPDYEKNVLTIEIHNLAYHKDDRILEKLCEHINETEVKFPGTELIVFYKMVSG
jgi:cell division septum initiation protein DivIVA